MPVINQADRIAFLHSPLGPDELAVKSLLTTEGLGRLSTFEIEAVSERDDIKAADLMGQTIAVEVECLLGPVPQGGGDGGSGGGGDGGDGGGGGDGDGAGGGEVVATYGDEAPDDDDPYADGPAPSASRPKGGGGKKKNTGSRFFHGHVIRFAPLPRTRRYFHYRLTVVPWLWFLTRTSDCRIFQKKSIPDILKQIFQDAGFTDFELRLSGDHKPHDYCVQYRETDFNFVSRLMEEEGIYYFFTHTQEKHTLILCDGPDAHHEWPGYETIKHSGRNESRNSGEDRIFEWLFQYRHHTGAFTHTDYDFTKPKVALLTNEEMPPQSAHETLEVYDYPGAYPVVADAKAYNDGKDLAKIRMQELHAEGVTVHGHGDARGLASGFRFELTEPPIEEDGGTFLLLSNSINLQANVYETDDLAGGAVYRCTFVATRSDEVFRPPRLTPKPLIHGVQTAVVTGPAGEEIHTDKYGRIKVQFFWDREGKQDENTTCFIRVGQVWAGKRWGATFIPRIGQEVIVAFLEGDPDQPIVVGSVYNGDQMPPYLGEGPDPKHKHDPKVSGIKSLSTKGGAGFNELRFDDNKGNEEIFLHAEKNLDTRVLNDAMENIGNSRFLTVGSEKDGAKTGDQFEMVMRNKHLKVHKDQEEIIGGVQKLHVGGIDGGQGHQDIVLDGHRQVLIKTDDHLHVKGVRKQKVDKTTSLTVGGDQQEKVTGDHALDVAKEIHLKAGTKFTMEAGVELTVKCGAGFISIKADGTIAISGSKVLINSGGAAGSGKGSSPEAPTEAAEAAPTLPTVADDSKTGSLSSSSATPAPAKPAASAPPGGKSAGGGAASAGAAAPGKPAVPSVPKSSATPGFLNCVKNAAGKAGEAIDQGKKTVDEATKAVNDAIATAKQVKAEAEAALQNAKSAVANAKAAVHSAGDAVDHLKNGLSTFSFDEIQAGIDSGKDAVKEAKDAVQNAEDAVTQAKAAVADAEAGVQKAIEDGQKAIANTKATIQKADEAVHAAGECI